MSMYRISFDKNENVIRVPVSDPGDLVVKKVGCDSDMHLAHSDLYRKWYAYSVMEDGDEQLHASGSWLDVAYLFLNEMDYTWCPFRYGTVFYGSRKCNRFIPYHEFVPTGEYHTDGGMAGCEIIKESYRILSITDIDNPFGIGNSSTECHTYEYYSLYEMVKALATFTEIYF